MPPTQIVVTATSPPVLTGAVLVSGFGSDIVCEPGAGAGVVVDAACLLPLTVPADRWLIDGNQSALTQIHGDTQLVSAAWALPIAQRPTALLPVLPEAPHGGSLIVQMTGDLRTSITGISGQPFVAFVSSLIANACRLEMEALQLRPGGRADFALWRSSRTRVAFGQEPVQALRFRSERGADDLVGIRGGRHDNEWDAPHQSNGSPFPFAKAEADTFGLVGWPSDPLVTCLSHRIANPADTLSGIALENAYLIVRQPLRCAFTAAIDAALTEGGTGLAFLFVDGREAIPTLPDPYASNLALDRALATLDTFPHHLRIALEWLWSQPPVVAVTSRDVLRILAPNVAVPDPPPPEAINSAWLSTVESSGPRTLLLDLSTHEHLFGVAIEARPGPRPTPADPLPAVPHFAGNQLRMPLNSVRLFMQPQVHWEPLWAEPNPDPSNPILKRGRFDSATAPGLDLVAADGPNAPVAVLPAAVTRGILDAIRSGQKAAALFSLPFGMRGVARLTPGRLLPGAPGVVTSLHEPDFGRLHSAQQLRLEARALPQRLG